MIEHDTEVKQCAAVGHVYGDLLLIRCGHRESVSMQARCWVDEPDGETRLLDHQEFEFGPFDTYSDVAQQAGRYLGRMIDTLERHSLDSRIA